MCLVSTVLCQATQYRIQDLGLLTAKSSYPLAINDNGDVLGECEMNGSSQYFLWTPESGSKMLNLPKDAAVRGFNNKRQVVGFYTTTEGWFSKQKVIYPFIWTEEKGLQNLGLIKDMLAFRINDEGTILLMDRKDQLFVWKDGVVKMLPGASHIVRNKHNSSQFEMKNNQLAYIKQDPIDKEHPIKAMWQDLQTQVTRPFLQAFQGTPHITDINKSGYVVGYFKLQRKKTGYISFPDGKGETFSNFIPLYINEDGIAVGQCKLDAHRTGCIYKIGDTEAHDINEFMLPLDQQPIPYENIVCLNGINQDGFITAIVSIYGKHHAVLLEPIEEIPTPAE